MIKDWSGHIKVLEDFDWSVLEAGYRVSCCEVVVDPVLFVGSHLGVIRANKGTKVGQAYIRRLWKVYKRLKNSEK